MDPMTSQTNVINFIDEVNKQKALDNAKAEISNLPEVKLRGIEAAKKDGVNTCMNSILTDICKNSVPEVNGRTADTEDLDAVVQRYFKKKCAGNSDGNDTSFYVKEAIKKNPKDTAVLKSVIESVERIINEAYADLTNNPDKITDDDYKFVMTPEIQDKLQVVIRDNNLDSLSDAIKDNVYNTAIGEVELAKQEKEERMNLENELMNDDSVTSEAALEEALKLRGYNTKVYTPSLFEAVMINKFNQMEIPEYAVIEFTIDAEPLMEGVADKIKSAFSSIGGDLHKSIEKSHLTYLSKVEGLYKATYSLYKGVVSSKDIKKLVNEVKGLKGSADISKVSIKSVDVAAFSEEAEKFRSLATEAIKSKTSAKWKKPKCKKTYTLDEAIEAVTKPMAHLDSFFGNPDVKKYVNSVAKTVGGAANKCSSNKEVSDVYQISSDVQVTIFQELTNEINFINAVVKACENILKKANNTSVKEAAFDEAIKEYTLLSLSKALYLESFSLADIDNIVREYATK